jgi:TIR domain
MSNKVKIFISHKKIDADAACAIQRSLERLGTRDRLTVFVSAHMTGGTDWFRWIQESLSESNLLLLLYTDRTEDWDWCMYEAGLFTDLKGVDTRKVVCIQSTDDRPEPLKHLQNVPNAIGTLVTALVMATRFRYEILSPYLERLKVMVDPDMIAQICRQLVNQVEIIEQEGESRDLLDASKLLAVFDNESDQKTVSDMYHDWYVIRSELYKDIRDQRTDKVRAHLQRLSELNRLFLDVGTHRLHELNRIDHKPKPEQMVEHAMPQALQVLADVN